MAMSSSSLPCNGRVPNVHLYENPTSSIQDRDLIDGHLCRSHNHVNNVNVNNNSNTNHSPVADPIRQSHSIPTAISSKGNVSPGIGALLSPNSSITHQPQVQNGHLPSHHRPHHQNHHNEKSTHQKSRKSGRHPEKHPLKSKTSAKSGQSIPRTSYLPSSNSHPAHHVTSPTLSSLTEAWLVGLWWLPGLSVGDDGYNAHCVCKQLGIHVEMEYIICKWLLSNSCNFLQMWMQTSVISACVIWAVYLKLAKVKH